MASTFANAAEATGISQIVYLGGIANGKVGSYHLASPENTGKALNQSIVKHVCMASTLTGGRSIRSIFFTLPAHD